MTRYEYKVVPAPKKSEKSREARTTPDRFALALTRVMNDLAREGWEYLRSDTLPCEERAGLTGTQTHFQSMLVFRRALAVEVRQHAPIRAAEPPLPPTPAPPVTLPVEGRSPALGPAGVAAE